MNIKKWFLVGALAMATAPAAIAVPGGEPAEKNIVETAVSAGNFETLVAAVKAAGLVDALSGRGPLTVLAPTDAAFEKLEKSKPGTIAMLLKPENKKKLAAILTYHVVSGKVVAADVVKLKDGTHVKTLNGASIAVRNRHGVRFNKSKLVKADIECSNGVIHVIDTVLLPK